MRPHAGSENFCPPQIGAQKFASLPQNLPALPPIVNDRSLRWTISHGFDAICLLFKIEG